MSSLGPGGSAAACKTLNHLPLTVTNPLRTYSVMSSTNNRASLLSGLRTGGVRTSSIPQTAAIGGSFQPPRFSSGLHHQTVYEDGLDNQNPYQYGMPMTAAIDGRAPRFHQQQQQAQQQQQQHQQQQQQQQLFLQQAQLAAMGGMQLNPMDPLQSQLLQLQLMQAMVRLN